MDASRYAALFAAESREHLAEIDTALLTLEQTPGTSSGAQDHAAPIGAIFRGMHTIKGMAAAMGHDVVEQLTHALESRCEPLRSGSEALRPAVLDLLFDGTALLRDAIASVTGEGGETEPKVEVSELARRVSEFVVRIERDTTASASNSQPESDEVVPPVAAPSPISSVHDEVVAELPVHTNVRHVDVRLTADCPLKGVRALLVLGKLQQVGLVRSTHPAQAQWSQESFDGVFRVILVTGAEDERVEQAVRSAGDVAHVNVRRPLLTQHEDRGAANLLNTPLLREVLGGSVRGSATDGADGASGARADGRHDVRLDTRLDARLDVRAPEAAHSTVRVDARRLDALLDLVGELVITRDRLVRAVEATEHPDREIQRAARDAARLVSVLQDEVLQARLLPIAQVFDRFPRLVRDMARDLGKDVRFVMEGRELALDRSLLDALADPVLHLLRNAVDHGLEDPATRVARGKPASGELIVRAARDRATVVVQVQDDGRGIDREAVRTRAQALGLLAPDQDGPLDDDTLLDMIAHPGFSTAQKVSKVSGRGVGVDVVNTRVRALGGQLELETIDGVGTVVTMRLPASLAITRALLVQVGGDVFALPAAHVEEAMAYHEDLRARGAQNAVTIRDEVIPLVALRERFGLPADEASDPHVAVVEMAGKRAAVLVDGLLSQQDIVVKPLDVVQGAAPWFSGATVLGDGSPALIVDVTSVV
ncbi:MAG: chemotaxis protein CheA [Gemmatimonadaceae bacterium]|nr:chemotaxis protein CheA [Gemmatimonadaceae bacterium]